MILLAAATDFELEPARKGLAHQDNVAFLVSGVGPVETAFSLTRHLSTHPQISAVVNFGVAGAYPGSGLHLLDLCLAEKESLADFGICFSETITPFESDQFPVNRDFDLKNSLFDRAKQILDQEKQKYYSGTFLTVNCASGTQKRGEHLQESHRAICENMEGAAIARVCRGFDVDCLELRCISNMVEDRDPSAWRLQEASRIAGEQTVKIVENLL